MPYELRVEGLCETLQSCQVVFLTDKVSRLEHSGENKFPLFLEDVPEVQLF